MLKRVMAMAAVVVLTSAPAFAQRVEVGGVVGWTFSDGVEGDAVLAADGNLYDAIDVKDSHSTATGDPYVEALVGRNGGKIIAAGNITVGTIGLYDADAATSSVGGGAIHVNLFYAKADLDPTVKTTVAGNSLIKSTNGTVTIDATASESPQPTSDGTFNAGDGCPLDGGSPGCVDATNNTITFSLIHRE